MVDRSRNKGAYLRLLSVLAIIGTAGYAGVTAWHRTASTPAEAPPLSEIPVATVTVGGPSHADLLPSAEEKAAAIRADAPAEAAAAAAQAHPAPVSTFKVATADSLDDLFQRLGYRLASVRAGESVPRVVLARFPRDFHAIPEVERRKRLFVKSVLPLVLDVNEELAEQRGRLERLARRLEAGEVLDEADRAWIAFMAARYGTAPDDIETLLERIDIIPPSIAVAQAAIESGWATSRFAREGNALFGQYSYARRAEGIVPAERAPGETFKIRSFRQLRDAVRAYAHNLNTHYAYAEFRARRAAARRAGRPLDGYELAGALTRYSVRGDEYVEDIRKVIRANDLAAFDQARLARAPVRLPTGT